MIIFSFVLQKLLYFYLPIMTKPMQENLLTNHILMLNSIIHIINTTTCECICLRITAALFPVISHGLTQCFTPFAAYEFYPITHIHPLGKGIIKAPLQNP